MNVFFQQIIIFLFLGTLLFPLSSDAQKVFREGMITYQVEMQTGQEGSLVKGTYTIFVKGKYLRKILQLNTGYHNEELVNGYLNTIHSLRFKGKDKYAIQLHKRDVEILKSKWSGPKNVDLISTHQQKLVQGLPGEVFSLKDREGQDQELVLSSEYQQGMISFFDEFPGVKNLPLSFIYKTESGTAMKFEAVTLKEMSIETSAFQLSPDYQIIPVDRIN